MKKKIAIVAGGDQSECEVSLRSAEGLYGFIDKKRYDLFIVTIVGEDWSAICDDTKFPIDKNDFSFVNAVGQKVKFDFA